MQPISRLLIANRGEIACRIIRTARKLGIHTIAIYSDIDIHAQHVLLADEAHCVGQASASQSYLNQDNILAIAQQAKVDAIHPGYGFLSENTEFAEKCAQYGIIFVGPPSRAIRAMGAKSQAKQLMSDAGVPITKGYHGDNQDEAFLAQQADVIGYPVMIKACAGGGGKGMRIVDSNDFMEQLSTAKREARKSFGNDHVLIETFIKEPRHIEIQIFCDTMAMACICLIETVRYNAVIKKLSKKPPHRVYQMQHAKPWAKPLYKQLKLSSMSEQAQ